MFPAGDKSAPTSYTSSNQAYGATLPKWNAGTGISGYGSSETFPSQSRTGQNGSSLTTYSNGYRHNEETPTYSMPRAALSTAPGGAQFSQQSNGSGIPLATLNPDYDSNPASAPWKPQTLYNTGEPLGKLSSAMVDGAKGRYAQAQSRDAMKDKLVNTLSSDTNIAILPGFAKPYEETKFSSSNSRPPVSLNNGAAHSWYAERVPSPVARAQQAIGETRDHIGKTQSLLTKNSGRAAGLYRNSKHEGIIGGIPGIGENQYSSMRQNLDKSSYRRDLQKQMEQARIQKEAERNAYRNITQHPLGPSYNAHTPHTYEFGSDNSEADRSKLEAEKFASYLRAKKETVGQTMPSRPMKQPSPEMTPRNNWANQRQGNTPQQVPPAMQRQGNTPQQVPPAMQQQFPNPYYPPQPLPSYPYSYPMYSPQPQQGHPIQPAYPQPQYAPPMHPQAHQGPNSRQYSQFPLPVQAPQLPSQAQYYPPPAGFIRPQKDLIRPSQNQSPRRPTTPSPRKVLLEEGMELEFESDAEIDESLFITKKWQHRNEQMKRKMRQMKSAIQDSLLTSEQLPNAALKNAAYQLGLKKQIVEKQKEAENKRLKEIEEDEKLERKNAEYNERMRLQVENEQANLSKLDAHTKIRLHVKPVHSSTDRIAAPKDHTPRHNVPSNKPSPREIQLATSVQPPVPGKAQKEKHKSVAWSRNIEDGGGDVARSKNKSHPVSERNTPITPRGKVCTTSSSDSYTQTDDDELLRIKLPAQHHADLAKKKRQKEIKLITRVQSTLDIETRRMERLLRGKVIPTSCPNVKKLKHPVRELM